MHQQNIRWIQYNEMRNGSNHRCNYVAINILNRPIDMWAQPTSSIPKASADVIAKIADVSILEMKIILGHEAATDVNDKGLAFSRERRRYNLVLTQTQQTIRRPLVNETLQLEAVYGIREPASSGCCGPFTVIISNVTYDQAAQ